MMIFRPQGLLPSRQRAAELAEATGDRGMGAVAGVDEADVAPSRRRARPTLEVPDRRRAARGLRGPRRRGRRGGARPRRRHDAVRRRRRPQRRVADRPPRPDLRDHRPQRRRQDHASSTASPACSGPTDGDIAPRGPRRSSAARRTRSPRPGVARTFQNIRLFPNMTAIENVMVGTDARHTTSVPGAAHRHARSATGRSGSAGPRRTRLLEFVGIAHRAEEVGPQPALRRPAPPRDRPGHRHAAQGAPARRAGRRLQPGREAGARRAHPPDPRRRPHGGAHRARHGGGDGGVRPHRRDRLRREDRRGPARGDPERPAGHPGLPGGGPSMLLELEDVHVHYGKVEALKGIVGHRRRGRDRHPHRRQRRRQDHHPEDHLRRAARHQRHASRFEGEDITGMAARTARGDGHLPGARGPRASSPA